MAYTRATRAEFIAIFPPLAAVSQEQYDFWAEQAEIVTIPREECLGARLALATMLATAWNLTDQGIGTGTEAEMAAAGASGFTRIKSGSIELAKGESTSTSGGIYASNAYGRQFWAMLKPCLAGPLVTDTGYLPCGSYGRGPLGSW